MTSLSRRRTNWTPILLAFSILLNIYLVVGNLRRDPAPAFVLPADLATPSESGQEAAATLSTATHGPRRFAGSLRGSIAATLNGSLADEEAELVSAHLARSLSWQLDLRTDLRPEDHFVVVYRYGSEVQRQSNQGPGDPLEILAYSYRSTRRVATYRGYRFQPSDSKWPSLWDETGAEVALRLKSSPVEDYEAITSRLNDGRGHDGVDFKVPVGTPVRAPRDAKILRKNWNVRANGYCVDLLYEDSGIHGIFLHLSDVYDHVVVPGQKIRAGTVFALSGNTGKTTNPHLHYGIRRQKDKYLDPFDKEATTRHHISAEDAAAFAAAKAEWDALLD